ncbi:hypothetical protein JCM10908_000206 [Rhodotorula pacifica]|uniref:uncharacterized protein n=1 Tax=Rhodotorula pacifica TaxID=1495444 RepID=UPI00317674AB
MSSNAVSSLAFNTTLDDASSELQYIGPWTAMTNTTAGWQDNTLTYCGGSGNSSSSNQASCEMRLTVNATWFGVFGHQNASQGVYSCRLEYEAANGTVVPAELPWGWWDGAHSNGARANPIALCSAYNLPLELYTLVVSVQPDQVSRGLGIDSVVYANLDALSGGINWYSVMNPAVPPAGFRDTTASPMLPPSTSSSGAASSPTSLQTGGLSGGTRFGLGIGLGGLSVVLAILAAWYYFRIRRRASARKGTSARSDASLHSLSWTPSMHSLRSSTLDHTATGSSTCLWVGGPHAATTTSHEHESSANGLTYSLRPGAQTPDFTIVESSQGPFDDKYAASEFSAVGTTGSDYHRSSMGPPPVVITPASDTGTIGPSPFDDPIDSPTDDSLDHSRIDLDDLDLDAPLAHPDSFRPR